MGHDIDFSAIKADDGTDSWLGPRGRDFDAITPHAPSLLNISIRDLGRRPRPRPLPPFLAAGLHPHPLDPMDKRGHHRLFVGTSKVNRWIGTSIKDASTQGRGLS